jgi:anti-sigma B factor antagonist
MLPAKVLLTVRPVTATTSIIDIQGEVSAFAERSLLDAYRQAATPTTRVFILNFSGLEYMNSGGIGLLVSLLIQIRRQQQRLLACGLSAHYWHLFELTRCPGVSPGTWTFLQSGSTPTP